MRTVGVPVTFRFHRLVLPNYRPDGFVFMQNGSTLSPDHTPFMQDQEVIDGAFAYTFWKGDCDAGMQQFPC
jgi:hypothetical protein